jgi:endonuclease III
LLEVLVPALRHAEPLVPASRERVVSQQLAGWCTENRKRHVHTRLTCTGRWPCRPSGGGRACKRARPRCRSCLLALLVDPTKNKDKTMYLAIILHI